MFELKVFVVYRTINGIMEERYQKRMDKQFIEIEVQKKSCERIKSKFVVVRTKLFTVDAFATSSTERNR